MKAFTFALLTMVFWGFAPVFAKIGLIKTDPFTGLALRTFVVISQNFATCAIG